MKTNHVKKLAFASLLCALAVVGSMFSVPVLGSKCAPVQHIVNVVCAVVLGPGYGVGVAFVASLLRNLLGLGSLLAFPGSMIGALLSGLAYKKWNSISLASLGEIFGTSILGGLCAWPIAILLMGKSAGDVAVLCLYRTLFNFDRCRQHYCMGLPGYFEKSKCIADTAVG